MALYVFAKPAGFAGADAAIELNVNRRQGHANISGTLSLRISGRDRSFAWIWEQPS